MVEAMTVAPALMLSTQVIGFGVYHKEFGRNET